MRVLPLICAIALGVVVGCKTIEFPPPPPDPTDPVFDELESGACEATRDWYENDYDPWADAYCRAAHSADECGTDAEL